MRRPWSGAGLACSDKCPRETEKVDVLPSADAHDAAGRDGGTQPPAVGHPGPWKLKELEGTYPQPLGGVWPCHHCNL